MSSQLSLPDLILGNVSSHTILRTMHDHSVLITGAAAGVVIALVVRYIKSPWRKLPPGPPGLPLIGNALQIVGEPWLKYSAWRKEYGDIIYLNAAGRPLVVLNNAKVANELLDRRAGIYSDRPPMIVASEILCGGISLPFARYNETWRRHRKASHEALNKVVAHGLNDYQIEEALVLARNGLQNAAGWDDHLRGAAAGMMLRCLYDDSPASSEHAARVRQVNEFAVRASNTAAPGAYWVEMMPWMRHIPSFLAPWKRTVEEWNREDSDAFVSYFDTVQKTVDEGTERASLCATLIHDSDRHQLSKLENAWLAASIYAAGSDTSRAALTWWSFAMLIYPDVQKQAQKELDAVIGRSRVPTFADMPHLPYICAVVKEVLRWRPTTPYGLPHHTTEDDYYEGYFIPKGTIVLANTWEMNRDPEVYGPDAHHFNPNRHLGERGEALTSSSGVRDDGHYSFGFGRRICVGRHVAFNSLFIDIATCLWAFSFANVKGQELDVDAFLDTGLVVVPKPFEVDIEPRFPEALSVLSQECELRGR
ncbi:cytochrome P450 [Peniophora sp. CONT]|nr:cytochrome P450 [Peniophora sp. CONT]